jgi:hypothetical protein
MANDIHSVSKARLDCLAQTFRILESNLVIVKRHQSTSTIQGSVKNPSQSQDLLLKEMSVVPDIHYAPVKDDSMTFFFILGSIHNHEF